METLRFYSIKLKKLKKISTFFFIISSNRHDMITFEQLIERTSPDYTPSCYFISYLIWFFFEMISKTLLLNKYLERSIHCLDV